MKPGAYFTTSARWMGVLLLALLLLAVDSAGVRAAPPPDASSENMWTITVSQPRSSICVGEHVYVTVTWRPNQGYDPGGGLVPLFPLNGPSQIKVTSRIGRFIPESTYVPKSQSGTTRFAYVADQEGSEKVAGVAMRSSGSDGTDTDTFTVKKCDYRYTLDAVGRLYVQEPEGGSFSTQYTVRSSGLLMATDTLKPRNLEGREKKVRLASAMTSFSVPKCALFTWEPGRGQGSVDVRAAPGPDDDSMVLEFGPPQELAWDVDLSWSCEGQPMTVAGVYPSVAKGDPWISATFPAGGGQQNVKLDMFEIPMSRMSGSPSVSFSYTAIVTLERVEP